MHSKKSRFLGVFIGLILSVGVLYVGFTLAQGYFTRASDEKPQNVTISDITDSSATVSWTTSTETEGGVLQYGVSSDNLTSFAPTEGPKTKNHTVELTLLAPTTTYYFEIFYNENTKYDNNGAPWSFITKDQTESSEMQAPTTLTAPTGGTCSETDCEAIKAKLGNGCSTQDYIRCIKKPEEEEGE